MFNSSYKNPGAALRLSHGCLLMALSLFASGAGAEEAVSLAEIVVTATRTAKPVDETPGASYVVTARDMEKRNVKSIDEAISLIPGVFQRRGKGAMDTLNAITLRGVPDAKRSLIMVDGLPINDAYTNGADVGGFAPDDLERVEVALGPGSSLYGSSAMGGVVNFVSRMPQGEEYRFKLGYGDGLGTDRASAHLKRAYLSAGNVWQNGLSLIVSAAGTQTDGYVTEDVRSSTAVPGSVSGAMATTTTAGLRTYVIGDKGDNGYRDAQFAVRGKFKVSNTTSLNASYQRTAYHYDSENPNTYLHNAAGADVWTYGSGGATVRAAAFLPGQGEVVRDLFGLGAETRVGDSLLKLQAGVVNVGANWYTTVSSTTASATLAGGAAATAYSQTPSRSTQLEATVTTPLLERHQLVWGAVRRDEKADTTEYDLADWRAPDSRTAKASESGGKAVTTGLFGQLEIEVTPVLRAFAGVRYDHWQASDGYAVKYGSGAFSRRFAGQSADAVSPRLGATWSLTPAAMLRASFGGAFRAPNVYELYRTWRATSGTVYASNPDLTPETMTGVDFGGDFKPWSGAELKATVYRNEFKDMIYRKTVKDDAEALRVCAQALSVGACSVGMNAGRARGQGMELSLRQKLFSEWAVFGGLAWNDTKILENALNPASVGKQFPQVPRQTATLGSDWERGAWSGSASARYVAQRYSADDNSDTVTGVPGAYDPYTVVDLKAAYRIDSKLKAALSIDNLFNREYYASYRAPGRAWFLELSGAF
jgi:iron complex outermembrane recepter protein